MIPEAVSVLTPSRGRPQLLRRAIKSVRAQDYVGPIEHVIVVDDCPATILELASVESVDGRIVSPYFEPRVPGAVFETPRRIDVLYPHIARLINRAAELATCPWVALLDDDNEYEPEHIRTLMERANETGCRAVHSSRKVFYPDGRPFLEHRFPWTRDPAEARRIYELMCCRGVWVRNTNILHDRAEPLGHGRLRNSTIVTATDSIHMVDTSVWLIDRELMRRYPVPDVMTEVDIEEWMCHDDKHLELLLRNGVRIASTGLPTLRYYLGGNSNS